MIRILTPISHIFQNNDAITSRVIAASHAFEARERTCKLRIPETSHYHIDFDVNLGMNEHQIKFLEEHVRPREEITYITMQASRDCDKVVIKDGMYYARSRILELEEQVENCKRSLRIMKNILGSHRVFGIENNNYYPTGSYEICTSLEFLKAATGGVGFELLLDYAHAIVTEYNLGIDNNIYIEELVKTKSPFQLHLCKPTQRNAGNGDKKNIMIDAHELPDDELTHNALSIMKKEDVMWLTIEYYKDAERLAVYLENLRRSINGI